MSATVDSRVVEMRFDNKQFESGVATTMNTLDKFQRSLKMEGATKGLEAVQTSANKINFANIENLATRAGFHVQDVWQKVANVFEYQIAAKIVNASKRMASALTIEPVTTGLQEYETQINAVQTILANTESKGTTLDQVNGALDTLNTYADQTIYNFTEMTRNIGTFTAAGVGLDTSVNAIQGIANLAAVSGSSSQQASTAMYQLSQALASGTVKLMDWNSVVNAGMGGQVFQDALKETARVHGVNVDKMIKKHGSFRETLQEGWITSDILTETLSHFTMAAEEGSEQWEKYKKSLMDQGYSEEQAASILKLSNTATDAATKVKTATQLWSTLKETAQSGWTQTWEIILGDFEEAKELFSGIYKTLSPMLEATAKARNTLLEGALSSNWDKMVKKINEAGIETDRFEEKLRSTAEAHGVDVDKLIEEHGSLEKAFRSGAISSDILKEAVKGLEGKLVDLSGVTRELKKGMKGDDVKQVQQALEKLGHSVGKAGIDGSFGKATQNAVKAFQEANGLKVTGIVDDKTLKALEEASGKADGLSESVGGLIANIDKLGGRELLIESLKNIFDGLVSVAKPIGKAFRDIFPATTAEQLYSVIESFNNFTKKLTLSDNASKNLGRTFKGVFAILDIGKQFISAVVKAITPLFGKVTNLSGGLLEFTANIGDWLVDLSGYIHITDYFGTAIEKIGNALGKVKNFFKPVIDGVKSFGEEIGSSMSIIADNAKERLGPLAILGNVIKGAFVGLGKVIKKIFPHIAAIASAIGSIISKLIKHLTSAIQSADFDELGDMMNGGLIATIGLVITKFVKSAKDIIADGDGILAKIENILDGVKGAISSFTESIKAETLKKIAVAIAILAASLFVIALIDSDKLKTSLTAVAVLFGELMAAMKIFGKMSGEKDLNATGRALIKLAAAIFVLSLGLKIMSTMSWSEMGVGLISLTVGLGALVGAVNLLPDKKVKGAAKAIKTMASAILILAVGLKIMSTMSWGGMGIALISMTVGLGALVAAVNLLPKDTAMKTAGLVGLATAMVILGAALKIMSSMSLEELAIGLSALVVSLGILVGAMNLMKKAIPGALAMMIVAPALVVLASALKIMGSMSLIEAGTGIATLAASLFIIAGAMACMKKALPGAAALLIVTAALAVLAPVLKILGSMSLPEIGKALLVLAGVFTVLGLAALILKPVIPAILSLAASLALLGIACVGIGAGILMIGLGITALATALASGGAAIVVFVTSIVSLIPFIIEQIGVGIIKLCEVIAGGASSICKAITVIIVSVVDALVTAVPKLVEGILTLIVELLDALVTYLPTIVPKLITLVVSLLNLLAQNMPALMDGIFTFIVAVIECLTTNITRIIEPIFNFIAVLFQGIANVLGPIVQNVIAPILSVLADLFVGLFEAIAPYIPLISATIVTITKIITDAIVKITEVLAPFIPDLKDLLLGITESFTTLVQEISPIIDSIKELIDTLGEKIIGIMTTIKDTITATGDAISEVLGGIAEVFDSAFNGIATVLDSVGTSIKNVLDGIAGVIESIGEAALNAGTGFENLANGVKTITDLKLGDMVASLAAVAGGVGDIAAHAGNIEKVGSGMSKLSTGATTAANGFKSMSASVTSMLSKLSSIVTTVGKVVTAFKSAAKNMQVAGADLMTKAVAGIDSEKKKLVNVTKTSIKQCIDAITGQLGAAKKVCITLASGCADAISSKEGSFKTAAKNLVRGFANGISANTYLATAKSRAMAKAAADAAKKELDEHSPSKVGYGIGNFFGVAFVNGIADNIKSAYTVSTNLARSARDGMNRAIDKMNAILSSDIDTQPTIRPVIDLSDVRSGASAISSMLNLNSQVGVRTNLAAISATMGHRGQNGVNDEVVSAINKLRKDIGNIRGGDTYQINGVTYDDGSNITDAVRTLVRAAKIEGRV